MGSCPSPRWNVGSVAAEIEAYLDSEAHGGPEIRSMISLVGEIGEVAIFGGMPRDVARKGRDGFDGDIDLVVDASSRSLDELFRSSGGQRNRFGGWRVAGRRHCFDVWTLQSTWAVAEGHVPAKGLRDLVDTTFFHSDAVVFLTSSGELHSTCEHQNWLRSRVVEMNLRENPNVVGTVSRILRIIFDWREFLSPNLAEYLCDKGPVVESSLSSKDKIRLRAAKRHLVQHPEGMALRQVETRRRAESWDDLAPA